MKYLLLKFSAMYLRCAVALFKEISTTFRNISKSSWYSSRNFIVGEVTMSTKIINNQNLIHIAKIIF